MPEDMPSTKSGFLETEGGVVSVFVTTPEASCRGVVLLCPPLFEERKAAAGTMSGLARVLSENGLACVRFDLPGTGDSPGTLQDNTVENWKAAALTIAARLSRSGLPLVLVGIRFGALLALETVAKLPPTGVVLWEPLTDGQEVLRQTVLRKLVNDMAAFGSAAASRSDLDAQWERGEAVDLDGYLVSKALRDSLQNFQPQACPPAIPSLLVPVREGREAERRRAKLCPAAEVSIQPSAPFWSTVGLVNTETAIRSIVAWIGERRGEPFDSEKLFPDLQTGFAGEEHFYMESSRGTLLPVTRHGGDGKPQWYALCLPGWSGCRLGPHNVFVEFARRAVEAGIETLRLDPGGRGDSLENQHAASITSMTDDAVTALSCITSHRISPGSGRLAVVAICSGCKVAIGAAVRNPAISLLVLWSPEPMGSLRPASTNKRKTLAMIQIYLLKLMRRETWRKILGGKVRGSMVGKALMGHETRTASEAKEEDRILSRFQSYQGRVVCVFGGGDPETAGSEKAWRGYFSRHDIAADFHTIPRAGHSFYSSQWRKELLEHSLAAFGEY